MSTPRHRPPLTGASPVGGRGQRGGLRRPELSLACLGAVTALGMGRIFSGPRFVPTILVASLGAFVVAHLTLRLRGELALLAQGVALGLLLTWTVALESTWYGLPTSSSWEALRVVLAEGLVAFREQAAPVPPVGGLLLLAVAGVWLSCQVAHELAFRLAAPFAALVGPVALFAITSALGTSPGRVPSVFAFAFAALVYLATVRIAALPSASLGERAGGTPGRSGRSATAALPVAALLAAAGVLVGPGLPGAGGFPLLDWRTGGTDRTRVTLSPLVDIKARLTADPRVELFVVRSPVPAYWRLTALEEFDGRIWSSSGEYRLVSEWDASRDGALASAEESLAVRQRFSIGRLDTVWLPSAYRPAAVSVTRAGRRARARIDLRSLSLIIDSPSTSDLEYEVDSLLARYGADDLESAPPTLPSRLSRLPQGFPSSVIQLAGQVTSGARSPYAKAKALQDWLRANFEYDQSVQEGHSSDHLSYFLFESKRGYCEQFAGAFAAMARAVGIPARVAVGFTPGSYDQRLGGYRVTTSEAHAWPEVRLEGFGWVAFEPTPGRNDVNPGDHTGTFVDPTTAGPDGVGGESPAEASTPPTPPGGTRNRRSRGDPDDAAASDEANGRAARTPVAITVARAALALAVLLVVAIPAGKAIRRVRRRATGDPWVTLVAAWSEALERLRECGLRPLRTMTPMETASDLGSQRGPSATEPLTRLAFLVTAAAFSEQPVSRAEVKEAWRCLRMFSRAVASTDGRRRRVLRRLHPGTLLDPGIGRPASRAG